MKKIISIGEVLVDVYSNNSELQVEVGGASFNVACSIAALKNNESFFMGSLGNDEYKEKIELLINKFNIKKQFIQYSKLATTIAKVTLDENKERFFEFIRNSDADFKLENIDTDKLKEIDFIHFGSATAFLPGNLNKSYWDLFKFAKENKIKFCFDPNFRDKLWVTENEVKEFTNLCEQFLETANLIKLSDEELFLLTKIKDEKEALKILMNKNKKSLICITRGSKDTMCSWNNEIIFVPTIKSDVIADTTGAGDAFISCLINEYVKEKIDVNSSKEKIIEIVSKANKFANKAVKYIGALSFLEKL
ncbi:carbohydrate kinase family protein [Spiroplasma cantharicola]|uniref:Fructokinase n=1 Tax=Spiroplasma cantharicola TaxID=362837 RepID=A0A0M4JJS4_9MOLU|nr:carbohydrate kinase [Spiroplasma cantharicola]ALD66486.1 fructokinase [Spiroplasma cantharicola]